MRASRKCGELAIVKHESISVSDGGELARVFGSPAYALVLDCSIHSLKPPVVMELPVFLTTLSKSSLSLSGIVQIRLIPDYRGLWKIELHECEAD